MRAYRKVKDHYEFRIDGGRLALLGVGASLVLVLVFLLGVLVGKALWSGRRLPVTVPVVDSAPSPPQPPAEVEVEVPARTTYTFYEELKKPDPPPQPPPAPAAAVASPPAAVVPAGPSSPPATEAKTAAVAPEPPRAPAPVFTVQVGSFRDQAAAAQLAKQVAAHGIGAQVVKASVAGRTWYRVQVGQFETRSDAETHYRRQLKPKGVQGFVTTR